jgi:hypothetical protein
MKTILISIIALSISILNTTNAQQNNRFEEETFRLFHNDSSNTYNLLNAINYNKELYNKGKEEINQHINHLRSKNLHLKPLKKQIQNIYKTTHAKFLRKYDEKVFFNRIFENGTYNCVTASALYALILDEFNINYSIKETPTHVYLIADTLGQQTLIESTLPGIGPVNFNEKFKKNYIEYLNNNKIISDAEFEHSPSEELFRMHYSKDKSINLSQLAAIQYYNKGIFLMQEEKYVGAALSLKKASSIYPSNTIKYHHFIAVQNALTIDYNKKSYNGKLFGQLIESSAEDSSYTQLLADYFNNVSVELCSNKPDIDRYDNFYHDFTSQCSFEKIPKTILHHYHYSKAYHLGITRNYPLALSEIKKAYMLNKNNLQVQELAFNIGIKHMFIESRYKNQIDSLEYYFEELPFLLENEQYQQQYVYYYMKIISDSFIYDDVNEGIKYYAKFSNALEKYELEHYSENHISIGFGSMAFYYLNKTNIDKAIQVLDTGLKMSPESLRLKQLRNEIRNAKQMISNRKTNPEPINEIVYKSADDIMRDQVNQLFPGKWKAVSILIEDMEQKLTSEEVFEFVAQKNKDCTYTHNNKTEKGKWAYRKKSKCIYFVPDYNKDAYKVFRVKDVAADKIVLLPYKDQKKASPYTYVLKPMN